MKCVCSGFQMSSVAYHNISTAIPQRSHCCHINYPKRSKLSGFSAFSEQFNQFFYKDFGIVTEKSLFHTKNENLEVWTINAIFTVINAFSKCCPTFATITAHIFIMIS